MLGKSIHSRVPEPSFYYAMLAASCFRRTARSCHPNARGVLRGIGCKYLAKAGCGVADEQVFESSLVQTSRTGARASRRQPWAVD